MRRLLMSILMLCTISILTACGGGSGSGGLYLPAATVTLSTSGTLTTGTKIGGIDATLVLPAGVTVAAVPDSQNPDIQLTDSGVVTATGAAAGSYIAGAYSAATGTAPGTVRMGLINVAGFGTGEFAVVKCNIAVGAIVTAEDFTTGPLDVVDTSGAAIDGLTAGMTVEIK